MKLKEFADNYKSRADCAAALGLTVGNLNVLINRNREILELADGRMIIICNQDKIFSL